MGTPPFFNLNIEMMFKNIKEKDLSFPKKISSECKDLIIVKNKNENF